MHFWTATRVYRCGPQLAIYLGMPMYVSMIRDNVLCIDLYPEKKFHFHVLTILKCTRDICHVDKTQKYILML